MRHLKQHIIIAVEGIDGCGKTGVIIPAIKDWCEVNNLPFYLTGSFNHCSNIKVQFLETQKPLDRAKLSSKAREITARNISELVQPSVIIIDRWAYSDVAYNEEYHTNDKVKAVVDASFHNIVPQLTIIGELSKRTMKERLQTRSKDNNVLDEVAYKKHNAITKLYRSLPSQFIEHDTEFKYVDCNHIKNTVYCQVIQILDESIDF